MPRSSVRSTSTAAQRRLKPEPEAAVKKFIKIIFLSTLEKKMMQVPERFVRLGPKLSDIVTLETPVGFKCSIGIKRIGDEVWFEKGWSDFVEAHSISEGHLLYFHYKENSSFDVVIFNVSASEIEYPVEKFNVIESEEEMIDCDELVRKNRRVKNIKSEEVIIID